MKIKRLSYLYIALSYKIHINYSNYYNFLERLLYVAFASVWGTDTNYYNLLFIKYFESIRNEESSNI